MISFFHKRRRQNRIAREIAASHDMLADYRAARRNGLSPLEALEEWDLLDEEAIKKMNKNKANEINEIRKYLQGYRPNPLERAGMR